MPAYALAAFREAADLYRERAGRPAAGAGAPTALAA